MGSQDRRVVLLGKTGAGKSSAGNTIFGDKLFQTDDSPSSITDECKKESRTIKGRQITLIDTPGFFDTRTSDNQLKPEMIKCITECSPGIHAFLIVLKVERYTAQEMEICTKIQEYFSDEAFKYATVLFTHGDQLNGKTIQEFVKMNEDLNDLVQKCGGRCHVIDNRYWNQGHQDEYRSNRFQVAELLKTIDRTVEQNRGGCYTNEMLQAVEKLVQEVKQTIRQESQREMSEKDIDNQARTRVHNNLVNQFIGIATGSLLGALFGYFTEAGSGSILKYIIRLAGPVGRKADNNSIRKRALATAALAGAIAGGAAGFNAAKEAETPGEAVGAAAKTICVQVFLDEVKNFTAEGNKF